MDIPGERAEVINRRRVFEGRVVKVDVDEIREADGHTSVREVVRHGGSVAVLPIRPDDSLTLVRQYRHPTGRQVWELCAGLLEPGEAPEDAAQRELREETGLTGGTIKPLLSFHVSPGYTEEFIHLFRATGQTEGPPEPDGDERIEVKEFSLAEARRMAADGRIHDAKTLLAILLEVERRTREVQP